MTRRARRRGTATGRPFPATVRRHAIRGATASEAIRQAAAEEQGTAADIRLASKNLTVSQAAAGSPDGPAASAAARELSLAAPVPAGDQGLGQPGKT
jgi:hypothetical protein